MPSFRQLAAIMFADIVGYSAIMQEDEAAAVEKINRFRQVIENKTLFFNGRIIQYYGDGCLLLFNSAVDAVNLAKNLQLEFTKEPIVPVRIGIHIGDVLIKDENVLGDAVNIAARIQALGSPGGILISEAVYYNISNKKDFQAKFLKEERLKNIKEPFRIYEVISGRNENVAQLLFRDQPSKTITEKSIAVLPFVDMSSGHDQEYLGDGLAEELINLLSQIKNLKVIGRTSSFSFKNKDIDLKTIGKILNASTILEGSVQKAGNRIRITAQLINANDGYHIWSQRYDRVMDDIFALQDDISSKIAEHLKLTLLEKHETALTNQPTYNLQAYELYLKGDFYYQKYSPEGFTKAIEYFERAVELDPNFADAWIYLGMANFEMHNWLYLPPERLKVCINCIQKALTLDPTNANAHYLLGLIHFNKGIDWEKTMSEIALGNKYNKAPKPLSFLPLEAWARASGYGEFDFAIRHFQKGLENDPLNIEYKLHLALINLYCFRDYKKSRTILKDIVEIGFPEPITWRFFCLSYLFEGHYQDAEQFAQKDYETFGRKGHGAANLIISLAASGKKEEAEQLYKQVKETLSIPDFPEFLHVRVNAWLGKTDEAFDWLDKAIEGSSYWLFTLKVSPEWDPLRNNPRFKKVLERLKFPL